MRRLPVVALGVAVVGLVVGALSSGPGAPLAQARPIDDLMMDLNIAPLEPQAPPPLTVATLDGGRVSLGDVTGRAVLVYLWATW